MNPLIRVTLAFIFLCLAVLGASAGSGSVKPVHSGSFLINNHQIYKLDSFLTIRISVTAKQQSDGTAQEAVSSKSRICSCQILHLESSNYNHREVVLLAEKTNDGSTDDYTIAKARLQMEKKHLKNMFYDKVEVVAEKQGAGSCKSMFHQLQTADRDLQLYEILDADIHPAR